MYEVKVVELVYGLFSNNERGWWALGRRANLATTQGDEHVQVNSQRGEGGSGR